jgi:hypothetical protein
MKKKDSISKMPEVILKESDIKSSFTSLFSDKNSANKIKKAEQIIERDNLSFCGTNKESTLDLMYKSCTDYSSRVWNVVRAELQDHDFLNK